MNLAQSKCLAVLAVFAVIGFGPVSPTCLIGMYVVLMRPRWFWRLTRHLYAATAKTQAFDSNSLALMPRAQCFLSLLLLFVVDIAPVPVTSVIGIIIVLTKPQWFYRLTAKIYGDG